MNQKHIYLQGIDSRITVLRDDLLDGGTKSILLPSYIGDEKEVVYASPVYGGFQIALAAYCKKIGKQATIFCAQRKELHENTKRCIELGAKVFQIRAGYLSVLEKRAREYCEKTGARKLEFGAKEPENIKLIASRMREVSKRWPEPDEIWCAIGSGTLVEGILEGTSTAKIHGVQVGKRYENDHDRLTVHVYPKSFDKVSKAKAPFPSMPNYDLKAWEICEQKSKGSVLFWNVL